jgi:hypothetical protein
MPVPMCGAQGVSVIPKGGPTYLAVGLHDDRPLLCQARQEALLEEPDLGGV